MNYWLLINYCVWLLPETRHYSIVASPKKIQIFSSLRSTDRAIPRNLLEYTFFFLMQWTIKKGSEVTGRRGKFSQVMYVPELFRMRKERREWENKVGSRRFWCLGLPCHMGSLDKSHLSGTDCFRLLKLPDHRISEISLYFLGQTRNLIRSIS